jgi:hypothetical protein
MKIRTALASAVIGLVTLSAAFAADVSGKWTAEVQGRNGQSRTVNLNLKADGDKLTGTMSGFQGRENPISDGKVSGDDISFVVSAETPNGVMKTTYTGKIAGDEIKMKGQREGSDRTMEFTAKRAQ